MKKNIVAVVLVIIACLMMCLDCSGDSKPERAHVEFDTAAGGAL